MESQNQVCLKRAILTSFWDSPPLHHPPRPPIPLITIYTVVPPLEISYLRLSRICKIDLLAGVVGTTYRQWGVPSLPPPPLIAVFAFFSAVWLSNIGLFYGCICCLLLCFPAGLLPLSCKFQLALPAVQVCFACGLLCLCWLFAMALWSVRSVFVCDLLWRWLWLLWTLADKSISQYSERPVLTLFGLDVCAVRSCSALLSGRCWFRAVLIQP